MKLYTWQRLFLGVLAFCLVAGGIAAVLLVQSAFSASLAREEALAVSMHAEAVRSGASPSDGDGFFGGSRLYGEDDSISKPLPAELSPDGEALSAFVSEVTRAEGCLVRVEPAGSARLLLVGSPVTRGGQPYAFLSVRDITPLYENRHALSVRALTALLLGSFAVAAAAGAVCALLLRPLSGVNRALRKSASGPLELHLPERGGQELRALTVSVNAMAQATAEQTRLLQETADSRKRFADSMAHEMKTPLTSILCMADLLRIKRSVTESERLEYAGVIVEEAKRMRALSSKLLTLASADGTSPDFRECLLSELLEEVRAALQPILDRRSLRLTLAGEDTAVSVDRQLFQTLLINLIDNAAKASADGQQILLYHTVQDGNLLLAVIDEGIGMTETEVRRATEAFWMADKSRSRKEGGAGLGLTLCSEIVKLHDAAMTITSEPGKGTTVQLTVPLRRKAPVREKKEG